MSLHSSFFLDHILSNHKKTCSQNTDVFFFLTSQYDCFSFLTSQCNASTHIDRSTSICFRKWFFTEKSNLPSFCSTHCQKENKLTVHTQRNNKASCLPSRHQHYCLDMWRVGVKVINLQALSLVSQFLQTFHVPVNCGCITGNIDNAFGVP